MIVIVEARTTYDARHLRLAYATFMRYPNLVTEDIYLIMDRTKPLRNSIKMIAHRVV